MARVQDVILAVLIATCLAMGCERPAPSAGCELAGPPSLLPASVRQVRVGMSKPALESVLGESDYSPIEGQHYFSTGGDCPLEGTDRMAPCGVIAEFRGPDHKPTTVLQSCRWGAIGE
jgi:hypothetical protein